MEQIWPRYSSYAIGHPRRAFAWLAILFVATASVPFAFGAGNHLDYNFSRDGMVTTNYLANSNEEGLVVAVQPLDGKIVVAGKTSIGSSDPLVSNFAVMRYEADGSLDTGFGANGKINIDFAGDNDVPAALTVQSNGRIVIVGKARVSGEYDFAVARLTPAGALDTTFSGDGKLTIDLGGNDEAHGLAIQSDNKIVVAGTGMITTGSSLFALARVNVNGSLDTTFDGNGKVATSFGGQPLAGAYDVITQPDGKLVACGFATVTLRSIAMARYNPNGSLDPSFNSGGRVTFSGAGIDDTALTLRLQANGSLLLAGYSHLGTGQHDLVILRFRFLADGTIDPANGSAMSFPFFLGNKKFDAVGGIYLGADLGLYATGYSTGPGPKYFAIVKHTSSYYDLTFGAGGHVFTYFGVNDSSAHGLALGKNGSVMVAGAYQNSSGNSDFAVASYRPKSLACRGDFFGHGLAEFAVFRPSDSTWYFELDGSYKPWGTTGDIPVPGDFDRDSISDVAVYRPSMGTWYVVRSSNQTALSVPLGISGDIPVQADYDGDGYTDTAVFRPAAGAWIIQYASGGQGTVYFGTAADKPVQADYDGDGLVDVAVFTPATGTWNLKRTRLGTTAIQFGSNGDRPLPADYDADGMDDIAVFRPSTATWYIINSHDNSVTATQWGLGTDIPAAGDISSDGAADLMVFRPSDGTWYVSYNNFGTLTVTFGLAGDIPIPSAYTAQ